MIDLGRAAVVKYYRYDPGKRSMEGGIGHRE